MISWLIVCWPQILTLGGWLPRLRLQLVITEVKQASSFLQALHTAQILFLLYKNSLTIVLSLLLFFLLLPQLYALELPPYLSAAQQHQLSTLLTQATYVSTAES
jgi:hypothetical protein